MADAEGEVVKVEAPLVVLRQSEHHPEGSTRGRQIDLHASGQPGPVPGFLVTGEEGIDGLPLPLKAPAGLGGDPGAPPASARMSSCQIKSSKATGAKPLLGNTASALAVGRPHGPVGGLELGKRRRSMPETLRDRLRGAIGGHEKTAVGTALLDNVGTLDVAAQLDVRLLHIGDDRRAPSRGRGSTGEPNIYRADAPIAARFDPP